jgi:predicted nucleic acid-binding protein
VTSPLLQIVVADANGLINLMCGGGLDLGARLPGFELVVPNHVREEITNPDQRTALDSAVVRRICRVAPITEEEDIVLFADLTAYLGRGDAACLVLAQRNGWTVLSDEKGRFRREVASRLGNDRIVGTADLFRPRDGAGLLTIEDGDASKSSLEKQRPQRSPRPFRETISVAPRGGR